MPKKMSKKTDYTAKTIRQELKQLRKELMELKERLEQVHTDAMNCDSYRRSRWQRINA